MHEFWIVVDGQGGVEDLSRLTQWLRDDEFVGETAAVSLSQAPPGAGHMGSAFDMIQLAVDSTFQVANLALAIAAWRRSHPMPPIVSIERDGTRVELSSDEPEVIAQVVSAFEADRGNERTA
ncbi:hypothetical protein ACFV29_31250 [Streptomyces sp. NPDC059690]|uniref:effector-associated constant component EACC1 n=1 Tax=Streptomyces sp. NPDC059690 TaxID=3346907 RepID=UPI0036AF5BFA